MVVVSVCADRRWGRDAWPSCDQLFSPSSPPCAGGRGRQAEAAAGRSPRLWPRLPTLPVQWVDAVWEINEEKRFAFQKVCVKLILLPLWCHWEGTDSCRWLEQVSAGFLQKLRQSSVWWKVFLLKMQFSWNLQWFDFHDCRARLLQSSLGGKMSTEKLVSTTTYIFNSKIN